MVIYSEIDRVPKYLNERSGVAFVQIFRKRGRGWGSNYHILLRANKRTSALVLKTLKIQTYPQPVYLILQLMQSIIYVQKGLKIPSSLAEPKILFRFFAREKSILDS